MVFLFRMKVSGKNGKRKKEKLFVYFVIKSFLLVWGGLLMHTLRFALLFIIILIIFILIILYLFIWLFFFFFS